MTVGDLAERELIARIRRQLPPAPAWMLVGIGDDAAVVAPERNRDEVLSVDALVEGIHFDRAFVPPDAIGHRALAVNLSDLAAMGATPRLALLSMLLPPALSLDDFDRVIGGFTALAARHRLHVAGGNLTRSPGPLVLDVTVLGSIKHRRALTRGGARAGDELYVSGALGSAAAGLQMLRETAGSTTQVGNTSIACVERYLRPVPRVRLGMLLSANRAATACMDLSDGLSDGIQQIADASGVGVIIDADTLPIAAEAERWFEARGIDAVAEALSAGDDYELLVAVHPRAARRFSAAVPQSEASFTRVGICTADRHLVIRRANEGVAVEAALPGAGYRHFQ